MAVILTTISPRSFEIVRDRIGEILADELSNQSILSGEANLNPKVWIERIVRFDHTEFPSVNIALPRGTFAGQTARQTDGTYLFSIQVYCKGSSSEGVEGDSLAMIRLQRLMGVCQSILEDARYKTLGYSTPFIMNRHFEEMTIGDPQSYDSESVVMGVLTFSVRLPETFDLIVPVLLEEYKTEVKMELTDKGYLYLKPL